MIVLSIFLLLSSIRSVDQRNLKTPNGKTFLVESEALAHAVANEWLAQKDTIMLSQMHINALCNTCIDNPGRTDKNKLVESILGKRLHIRKLIYIR